MAGISSQFGAAQPNMTEQTFRVTGPDFVAGFFVRDGRVTQSQNRVRFAVAGKTIAGAIAACTHRGWSVAEIDLQRTCGECFVCCVASGITVLKKKPGIPCVNLKTDGNPCQNCGIYDNRPTPCQTYKCVWLQGLLGNDQRPDQSGILVGGFPDPVNDRQVDFVIQILDKDKAGDLNSGNLHAAIIEIVETNNSGGDLKIYDPETLEVWHIRDGEIREGHLISQGPEEYESLTFVAFDPPIGRIIFKGQKT